MKRQQVLHYIFSIIAIFFLYDFCVTQPTWWAWITFNAINVSLMTLIAFHMLFIRELGSNQMFAVKTFVFLYLLSELVVHGGRV